jgi:hypothetical protein
MRYCEDYVISCAIEVWRGSENARVEYKRGEIGTVTVGGIDAPERLAEVMQWASGNYRLVVPALKLPAVAPKKPQAAAAAPAKVPAPAPSAQAARSATKTIFGMPAAEIIKARAAAEAAKAAAVSAGGSGPSRTQTPAPTTTAAPPSVIVAPQAASAAPPATSPAPAPVKTTPPGVAPSQTPAPIARSTGGSATKTIFGVPAPGTPGGYTPVTQPSAAPAAAAPAPVAAAPVASMTASGTVEDRSKTGARKVSVPAPEVSAAPADDPAATRSGFSAPPAEAPKRPSTPVPAAAPRPAPAPAPIAAAASERTQATKRETPIWTYVGVGVVFGAGMIGIWQLASLLAH